MLIKSQPSVDKQNCDYIQTGGMEFGIWYLYRLTLYCIMCIQYTVLLILYGPCHCTHFTYMFIFIFITNYISESINQWINLLEHHTLPNTHTHTYTNRTTLERREILNIKTLTFVPLISNNDQECDAGTEAVQSDRKWTNVACYVTTTSKHDILIGGATVYLGTVNQYHHRNKYEHSQDLQHDIIAIL